MIFKKQLFDFISDLIIKHPVVLTMACVLFFAITAFRLPALSLDTSTEGYLHEQDPALIAYNDFRDQFGRDEIIIVAVKPPEIFNLKFLDKLKQFHTAIEKELPYLDEVTSLVNARNTYGNQDSLIVEDLLDIWPANKAQLDKFKATVLSNPLYKNIIISEANRYTALLIKTDPGINITQPQDDPLAGFEVAEPQSSMTGTDQQHGNRITSNHDGEIINSLNHIIERYQSKDFSISVAGIPVMAETLKTFLRKDMRKFTAAAILLIIITLSVLFRRASGVILPLMVIIASTVSTVGIMAWTNTPIKLPTQILPSFLLAISVAASVHLLSVFYRSIYKTGSKKDAIKESIHHTGAPIVMTSVTTAIGLWSFSTAEVAPIADLGIFAGTGVIIALLYTLILLPSLLMLVPINYQQQSQQLKRQQMMDNAINKITRFATNNPKCIITASLLLLLASVLSLSQLYFYHNPLHWLPKNADIRVATSTIDQALRGTNTIEVVVNTNDTNGLYDPKIISNINSIQDTLEKNGIGNQVVGKTVSIADILKETHQALNENKNSYYTVPDNRETIAQELLLFENSGSNDLEELTDNQFSKARLTVKIPWADAETNAVVTSQLESLLQETFDNAIITVTGMVSLMGRTMNAAINSTKTSYVIAFSIITILMIILLGNIRLGLLSMIPNVLPVALTLGFMAYKDIPLDMFTMLIGSIAIGIVVDDTIHFLHVFQRNLNLNNNAKSAINETMLSTGRAILITSIVLSSGFFIFYASGLHNLQAFGLLLGITIIIALLADLFLLPAILLLLYGGRKQYSFSQTAIEGESK